MLLQVAPHLPRTLKAATNPTGIGAQLAAKQAQRDEFFIVGVDGTSEALDALKQNNSLFAATAAQDPFSMAAKAVEVGNNIRKGKKPADQNILIPVKLITRENVKRYFCSMNQREGWTLERKAKFIGLLAIWQQTV